MNMKVADLMWEAGAALLVNKARSALTILGIVIGIGSVIALVALGQGASGSIQSSIQSIGSNLILVMPSFQRGPGYQVSAGRGSAQSLTVDDANAIKADLSGVSDVAPEVDTRQQVTAPGTNTNTEIVGVTPAYSSVRSVDVDVGNFITEQNLASAAKVAVLGPTTRDDLFGTDAEAVGKTIKIKKIEFTVIGVTKAKGGTGFGSQDDRIFIPLTAAQRFLTGNKYVNTISVSAASQDIMTTLQDDITSLLLQRHNISDATKADFSTMNQADIASAASSVTQTLTLLLAAIAAISLVVGGIGIMNMMLTSVTERTREIGLRRAIGAKRREITLQVLLESVMLTFIGGFLGILTGWLLSWIVSRVGNIAASLTGQAVLLAFGVSAAIGIIFGFYPARRAASLNPIEALRYE